MSERKTESRALSLQTTNSPARVQAAGRQLSIAGELKLEIERRKLVSLLKRIAPESAVAFLSRMQAIDDHLIERFKHHWYWNELSQNPNIHWSIELIALYPRFMVCKTEEFEEGGGEYWHEWNSWTALSFNDALPWSIELIDSYKDHWHWGGLSQNQSLPWSTELIDRYKDNWNWKILSRNQSLPWSVDIIERYLGRWYPCSKEWEHSGLISNKVLPWSIELIDIFLIYFDDNRIHPDDFWDELSSNEVLPWSWDFLEHFKNFWHWDNLVNNKSVPWSPVLLKQFEDRLSPINILAVQGDPLSIEPIENIDKIWKKTYHKFDWLSHPNNSLRITWSQALIENLIERPHCERDWQSTLLYIRSNYIPWSFELLERYADRLDSLKYWPKLSQSISIPWSINLLESFVRRWDWDALSSNESIPWSLELLEHFEHRWHWYTLSSNESIPWSVELLTHFERRWDCNMLSRNESISWSIELIERFKDYWDCGDWIVFAVRFTTTPQPLRQEDIIEVMTDHLPKLEQLQADIIEGRAYMHNLANSGTSR